MLARSYDVHAVPLTTSSNYLKAGLDYFAIDYFAIMDAKDRGVGGPIRKAQIESLMDRIERAAKEAEGKEGGATVWAAFEAFKVDAAPFMDSQ